MPRQKKWRSTEAVCRDAAKDSDMTSGTAPLSPCIGLCRLDDDAVCLGCYRHIDEIAGWGLLAPDAQRKILARVAERRQHFIPSSLIADPDASHD